jgi:hypothetical protein
MPAASVEKYKVAKDSHLPVLCNSVITCRSAQARCMVVGPAENHGGLLDFPTIALIFLGGSMKLCLKTASGNQPASLRGIGTSLHWGSLCRRSLSTTPSSMRFFQTLRAGSCDWLGAGLSSDRPLLMMSSAHLLCRIDDTLFLGRFAFSVELEPPVPESNQGDDAPASEVGNL